jgi:hypothetical protein
MLAFEKGAATEQVDRAMLGRGHEPGAGVARNTAVRPLFERSDQRVVCEVLRKPDIANEASQPGDESG